MRAMILNHPHQLLEARDVLEPVPKAAEVLIRVHACAVCRTDLHIVDGELPNPKLPLIPGHEIVGSIVAIGKGAKRYHLGDRVGVPWLGFTCGTCRFCRENRENLCEAALFTGYTLDGGFAEYAVADERFCFPIPSQYPDAEAAPLLCAGLVGYRSLTKTGNAKRIGIYGFGAAAHIVTQIASFQGREIFAFTRRGDHEAQKFARSLGAVWAGDSNVLPPEKLDAAIIYAAVGELVPLALKALDKGGTLVCGGIHMSAIPSFPYELIWGERSIISVANLTRQDGDDFFSIAPRVPVRTTIQTFKLEEANEALSRLREGKLLGAAVLVI
jgi:propanol-preferring alcohol dehydrogenase